jgi:hypothetical protein
MSVFQKQRAERYKRSCLGVGTSGREGYKKVYRKPNIVEILYTHGKMEK